VKAPAEIDIHAFHDALGLMYPMNWRSSENGECETFCFINLVRLQRSASHILWSWGGDVREACEVSIKLEFNTIYSVSTFYCSSNLGTAH